MSYDITADTIAAGIRNYATSESEALSYHGASATPYTAEALTKLVNDANSIADYIATQALAHGTVTIRTGEACNHNGGTGIGAGHTCHCLRVKGHPNDASDGRSHGCGCGARWGDT